MKNWWRGLSRRTKVFVSLGVFVLVCVGTFFIPHGKKENFQAANEFILKPIIKLPKIGPVDLSINEAVLYLWGAVVVIVAFSIYINRKLVHSENQEPGRLQVVIEGLYDLARNSISNSVMRVGADRWFPYISGAFVFVLILNFLGLIPMPVGEHGQLALYSATGNLYVTITLAASTFFLSHYAGIKAKGGLGYVKGWMVKGAPPVMRQFIFGTHVLSEMFRLVSLSVRLFANMLAGHMLLAVLFAMALLFQSYFFAGVFSVGSVGIYLFEVFVAAIQAFIFAILSAVYISGAMEEEH
jgi:F-type H+-transporting ATPase subunit a